MGAKATRPVAAATASALYRSVVTGTGERAAVDETEAVARAETQLRLACTQPAIKHKVTSAMHGVRPCLSGRIRAARNVAVHNFDEPVCWLLEDPQASQRGRHGRPRSDAGARIGDDVRLFQGGACEDHDPERQTAVDQAAGLLLTGSFEL